MKKEELMKLGLDEATATKVEAATNEELKGFIPKSRFDEVNVSKKQLETDLKERDGQLETLKNSTGDVETLKKTISDLQTKNTTDKATYDAQVKKMQIDNAVERTLISAKAKNTVAVKALLATFLEKADLDGESIRGLDSEIKKLVESKETGFLFNSEAEGSKTTFKGVQPGEKKDGTPGDSKPASLADAVKLHFQSQNKE